jgi:hypothetical protein
VTSRGGAAMVGAVVSGVAVASIGFSVQFVAVIPFLIQCEARRTTADSAVARQGGATTYRFEVEME